MLFVSSCVCVQFKGLNGKTAPKELVCILSRDEVHRVIGVLIVAKQGGFGVMARKLMLRM